jgi:hypothetical protein
MFIKIAGNKGAFEYIYDNAEKDEKIVNYKIKIRRGFKVCIVSFICLFLSIVLLFIVSGLLNSNKIENARADHGERTRYLPRDTLNNLCFCCVPVSKLPPHNTNKYIVKLKH